MNYLYIDYMIKERRREESEECKRIQLLKAAECKEGSVANRLFVLVKSTIQHWRKWLAGHCCGKRQITEAG